MLIPEATLLELARFLRDYGASSERENFARHKKQKIKILVDTLWEQLINKILEKKPRNALEARRVIAERDEATIGKEDALILESLANVLKEYDRVSRDLYIELPNELSSFVLDPFLQLCGSLALHPFHSSSIAASKITMAIERVRRG
jgi:hypothetical protein